ncbi:DWNN-domain-containing protein [Sporormia fimetaria CBS 119925]|uniref:DWNN-domain-containing protein n=1 Tax=Sporormia fimetaria CBS 119925 TaxID=1340428 RepID=A0A6A6VBD2_9PLEO|nr:DWNN-domain-containing protein [Sporormia fimetaria CBS 119925]
MTSVVWYKFKNQKEPSRIAFNGTGISVFELKREIIKASGLGDGRDFDLHLYPEDEPTSEYIDDTTIISRAATVIAARRPAFNGRGRAARYVSGPPPQQAIKHAPAAATPATQSTQNANLSEKDREAAFLAESDQVWDQQKEGLSHSKPVFHKKKLVNVPAHDPPPGYVCYRCQKKGHWIQACPTNDDPDFKPVARAKRTTGIPRSFLKTVEKPTDEDLENARGIMLNADGEYVQVLTDTKEWDKLQVKHEEHEARVAAAMAADKEKEMRGLVCSIDNRVFENPVKVPCCGKTFCHDCIEGVLADSDLTCPSCSTEGVLLDELTPDEDMVAKVRSYVAEQAKLKVEMEKKAKQEAEATPPPNNETTVSVPSSTDEKAQASDNTASGDKTAAPEGIAASPANHVKSPENATAKPAVETVQGTSGNASDSDDSTNSKKRKNPPEEIKAPTAPKAMRMQKEQNQDSTVKDFVQSMEALKNMPVATPAMSMPMGMPMNPMMGMPPNMAGMNQMNPMANMGMNGYPQQGWNNGFNPGFQPQQNQFGMGFQNGMPGFNPIFAGNGMQGNMGPQGNLGPQGNMGGYGNGWNQGYGNMGYNQAMQQNGANGQFANQQQPNHQDAYERRPLNPHRAQNRNRKQRAPDFHYVG